MSKVPRSFLKIKLQKVVREKRVEIGAALTKRGNENSDRYAEKEGGYV